MFKITGRNKMRQKKILADEKQYDWEQTMKIPELPIVPNIDY
jgi:hypothetical protein